MTQQQLRSSVFGKPREACAMHRRGYTAAVVVLYMICLVPTVQASRGGPVQEFVAERARLAHAATTTADAFNIIVFIGTRPEAIKLAPVVKALRTDARFSQAAVVAVNTGQHTDMLSATAQAVGLEFNTTLSWHGVGGNMRGAVKGGHANHRSLQQLFLGVFAEASSLLQTYHASRTMVVVQGDTTTSLAAALAAAHQQIPVAHVEAGLRTYDVRNPFPEEFNRRLIDHVSTFLFPPTAYAKAALLREGFDNQQIYTVGNTVVDSLIGIEQGANLAVVDKYLSFAKQVDPAAIKVLVTLHRRESQGHMMQGMFQAMARAASNSLQRGNKPLAMVLPVHRNPRVMAAAESAFGAAAVQNILWVEPLDYRSFTALCRVVDLILTDSGGVQEEAVSLGVPTIVLRNITERPEGILAGVLELWPAVPHSVEAALAAVYNGSRPVGRVKASQVYGNGTSATQIAEVLARRVLSGGIQPDTSVLLHSAQLKQERLAWQSMATVAGQMLSSTPLGHTPAAPLNTTYRYLLNQPSRYAPDQHNSSCALTVVVSFHKRPAVVNRMLTALLTSSHRPAAIWLSWFAAPASVEINAQVQAFKAANPNNTIPILTATGDMPLGYWGRFQLGLQVQTPWVAFLDDDCIPGQDFLRNTFHIAMLGPYRGVFGIKGHRAAPLGAAEVQGPLGRITHLAEVDLVGGMWFMRSEHVRYMFWQGPQTWNTGEDVTLCYNIRVYGGMRCYVVPADRSDPRSMGVSPDYLEISAAGDTTGSKNHPKEVRQGQEKAYYDRGDYRAGPVLDFAADSKCKLVVYTDHGEDLGVLAQLIAGLQGTEAGCPGFSVLYAASYANKTGDELAKQLEGSAGFVLRPGLTWDMHASSHSNAARASDAMMHASSIIDMALPRAVLVNTTFVTAETLGIISASHLAGVCVVGVVDGKSAGHQKTATNQALLGLHQLVHVTPLLHAISPSQMLQEAVSSCMAHTSPTNKTP